MAKIGSDIFIVIDDSDNLEPFTTFKKAYNYCKDNSNFTGEIYSYSTLLKRMADEDSYGCVGVEKGNSWDSTWVIKKTKLQ